MFDLIDEFSTELWESKGTPPDNLDSVEGFRKYDIVRRDKDQEAQTMTYYLAAQRENQRSCKVICEGVKSKVDPLRHVRHLHAKIKESDSSEYDELTGILIDTDWIEKK